MLNTVRANLKKKNTEIIKSRIVSNAERVDADIYFNQLNKYLEKNYPAYPVLIIDQLFHDN